MAFDQRHFTGYYYTGPNNYSAHDNFFNASASTGGKR